MDELGELGRHRQIRAKRRLARAAAAKARKTRPARRMRIPQLKSVLEKVYYHKRPFTAATKGSSFDFFSSKSGQDDKLMHPLIEGKLDQGFGFIAKEVGVHLDDGWTMAEKLLFRDGIVKFVYVNNEGDNVKFQAPLPVMRSGAGLVVTGAATGATVLTSYVSSQYGVQDGRMFRLAIPLPIEQHISLFWQITFAQAPDWTQLTQDGHVTVLMRGLETRDLKGLEQMARRFR